MVIQVEPGPSAAVSISTRDGVDDPAWDGFLCATSGAHHTQSAAWGRVKALDGWRPLRIVAEVAGRPAGGAQVLVRSIRGLGTLGYVSRGPVIDPRRPEAIQPVLAALHEFASAERLRAIVIEPDPSTSPALGTAGGVALVPAHHRLSLGASVLVDVSRSPEELLAGLKSTCRRNVRQAAKRGLTVRRGGEADLPAFERLMQDTARRQGFDPTPASRYRRWFELLEPTCRVELLVAELGAEPVSAILTVAFGDTVVYKRGAWSGAHGDRRPNEALHWSAMQWAHASGHRRYDFDGIDTEPARRAIAGEPLPAKWSQASVTRFKLSFGGDVVILPDSQALIPNRIARRAHATLGPRLAQSRTVRTTLRRLRARS